MRKTYSRALPASWNKIAGVFTALGDEQRQRILLTFDPGERLTVGQLAEVSVLARTTVSHHLKLLREAGVLQSRKEGKEVFYWINKPMLASTLQAVLDYVNDET